MELLEEKEKNLKEVIENIINNMQIHQIWGMLSKEMQSEFFEKVIKKEGKELATIWQNTDVSVQNQNADIYLDIFENIAKSDDINDIIFSWGATSDEIQKKYLLEIIKKTEGYEDKIFEFTKVTLTDEVVSYIAQKYQDENLKQIIKINDYIEVSALEKIKSIISVDTIMNFKIKNASELSIEQVEELGRKFIIEKIQMEDENLEYYQIQPYDVETYYRCRKVIDELLEDVELSQYPNDPNREKRIFGKVIKRMADQISYDYKTYNKLNDKTATEEEKLICANMQGGLINDTCVCSGYAEIVRNVFACCGIKTKFICGDNVDPEKNGHVWNQIKLDGEWYNLDLTWDRDRIVDQQPTKYLLKSDNDFLEHEIYDVSKCIKEKCSKTISNEDLEKYIYGTLEIPKTMQQSINEMTITDINQAYSMIESTQMLSLENQEMRNEQWIK